MSLSPDQKLAAYLLGRRIAGQRRKQDRVPVAYLYNGVRLPGLPEWDKEAYPYAVIYQQTAYADGTKDYVLKITDQPLRAFWATGTTYELKMDSEETVQYTKMDLYIVYKDEPYNSANPEWIGPDTQASGPWVKEDRLIWSNYDLYLGTSDTVKLAASNPVPVYE